jgi:endonuclease YncB( thermonuclease family)
MSWFCCGSKLNNIEYDNTIPFIPNFSKCKVVKVYDGDTITVAAYLKGDPICYRFSVRLRGIDSPEIRTKNEDEKKAAIHSRDKLSEKILNKIVYLKHIGTEKYGRVLADVFYNNENINDWLLNNKLAVKYDGGKKVAFEENKNSI